MTYGKSGTWEGVAIVRISTILGYKWMGRKKAEAKVHQCKVPYYHTPS